MIEARGLVKTFGFRNPIIAVDDVSFSVKKGAIFGILGPKDAGKTTTLRILATTLRPNSGTVEIAGFDGIDQARKVRELIGFMPETTDFRLWSRGLHYLDFWGRVIGLSKAQRRDKIERLVDFLGIGDRASEDPNQYTIELQKRLSLAQALLSDPDVLILDEPMAGLNLPEKSFLAQKLEQLRTQGKTILLSSFQLRDVQLACDLITIMLKGRSSEVYDRAALLRKIGEGKHARIFVQSDGLPSEVVSALGELDGVTEVRSTPTATIVYVDPGRVGAKDIEQFLELKDTKIKDIKEAEITLGDVFRALHTEGET